MRKITHIAGPVGEDGVQRCMACGLPLIVPYEEGFKNYIVYWNTGSFVEVDNYQSKYTKESHTCLFN